MSLGGLSFTVIESVVESVVSGAGGLPGVSVSKRPVDKSHPSTQFASMHIVFVKANIR